MTVKLRQAVGAPDAAASGRQGRRVLFEEGVGGCLQAIRTSTDEFTAMKRLVMANSIHYLGAIERLSLHG